MCECKSGIGVPACMACVAITLVCEELLTSTNDTSESSRLAPEYNSVCVCVCACVYVRCVCVRLCEVGGGRGGAAHSTVFSAKQYACFFKPNYIDKQKLSL